MRSLDSWFAEYSESHQNLQNQKIHYLCVPVIFFSVIGLLYPWSGVLLVLASVFYVRLDLKLGVGMTFISLACFGAQSVLKEAGAPLRTMNAVFFLIAWVGQFVGHKIEGKKPSFLKDLAFLLIGPVWILKKISSRR